MYLEKILASNIRYHRIRLGLSQKELSLHMKVSVQAVSKWERGLAAPELQTVYALSRLFGVTVDALISTAAEDGISTFIGVDGGGGKTELVLFTSRGEVISRIVLSASNPNTVGMERTCAVMKEGIDALLPLSKNSVRGIYIGLAGIPREDQRQQLERFLASTYPGIPFGIGGDVKNVFASCVGVERGIVATVGTSSTVVAKTESEMRSFGGGGYLLEEGGSGFDLGREALRAAMQAHQGYGEKTVLTDMINEHIGSHFMSHFMELYADAPRSIAALAPLVFSAVRADDRVARRIVEASFFQLADRIALAHSLCDAGDILIFSGGLLHASELWMPILLSRLPYEPKVILPRLPQIFGACRLAQEHFGDGTPLPEERYIEDYKRIKASNSSFS